MVENYEIKHASAVDVRDLITQVFGTEQSYPSSKLFCGIDENDEFLILTADGKLSGCGRFSEKSKTDYHIDNIAFYKEMRGKGLGKRLISALVDKCRERGALRVTVNARRDAVGFYEKCGFAVCGCEFTDENVSRVPMVISFEFKDCKYIKAPEESDAYFLRCCFDAKAVSRAVIRIGVLGFVEPYLNGKKLSDDYFIPAWSNYEARDLSCAVFPIFDTMTQRRYYLEYDVTDKINEGKNALVLHIGNGWYGQHENSAENMPKWGEPKAVFKILLENEDNSLTEINSDARVLFKQSYIKRTNIYINETLDGREYDESLFAAEYDDSDWSSCEETNALPAVLNLQDFSGDRTDYRIEPKLICEDGRGKLYDLEADVSGFWVVKFNDDANEGDIASVSFAERIDENGDFMLCHTGGESRKQEDTYICGKNKREFKPVFTWRAGRYIRVAGNAFLSHFEVVYSPVKVTAEFKTENKVLAWFFDAYCKTQHCNIHAMIPSDCPHRERLGYTGDGQLCAGACMTVFDSREMYGKWLRDIGDCQDIYSGHVQHTAPMFGGGGGPGGWGGAMVIVPYLFYKKFGDTSVLSDNYLRMKKYLGYMQSRCDDNIVVREEDKGWCLGDWCAPDNNVLIPEEFVNTYFYLKCILYTAKTAEILGYSEDAQMLDNLFFDVSESFVARFFDEATGSFCEGIQGADAFGIDLGLGDERTAENLKEKYAALGHLDTGIFGTDLVVRVLFEKGFGSLAWQMLTNENEVSFANMMNNGGVTLWENWDGCDSLSHPMFGAVCEYLFTELLGIKQTEDSAGWKKIKIEPAYVPEANNISGSILTFFGRISVSVTYTDGVRCVKYSVPDGIELVET